MDNVSANLKAKVKLTKLKYLQETLTYKEFKPLLYD